MQDRGGSPPRPANQPSRFERREGAGQARLEEQRRPPATAAAHCCALPPPLRASPLQLQDLGVQQNAITFTNVTMESDKYICVRETGAQNQLVSVLAQRLAAVATAAAPAAGRACVLACRRSTPAHLPWIPPSLPAQSSCCCRR